MSRKWDQSVVFSSPLDEGLSKQLEEGGVHWPGISCWTHKALVCQVVEDVNRDCLVDGTLIQDEAICRWIHYGSSTTNGTSAIWGRHKIKYHRKYL